MFDFILGRKRKKKSSTPPLSTAIQSAVFSTIGPHAISPLPGSAARAFELATNPDAEAKDFVSVVASDEALSARVMRIANSVYFDRGNKCQTIDEAVLVIGVSELRCILGSSSLSEVFPSRHAARRFLWGHDIGVAILAKRIAQRLLPAKVEAAFLSGLMHDIGKLVLLQRAEDQYQEVLTAVERDGASFLEAEANVFIFNHAEVGQMIAERWQFNADLTDAIATHHTTPLQQISLGSIVQAADIIAHALGLGFPPSFGRIRSRYNEQLSDAWKFIGISSSGEQRDELAQCREQFELEYSLYAHKK